MGLSVCPSEVNILVKQVKKICPDNPDIGKKCPDNPDTGKKYPEIPDTEKKYPENPDTEKKCPEIVRKWCQRLLATLNICIRQLIIEN